MFVLLATAFSVALGYWLAPRLFTFTDRHLSKAQLEKIQVTHALSSIPHTSVNATVGIQKDDAATEAFTNPVDIVEHLARLTRSGTHARDALHIAMHHLIGATSFGTTSTQPFLRSIEEILDDAIVATSSRTNNDSALMCQLLKNTYADGVFIATALDHVAQTLRAHQSLHAEIRTATAQAVLTLRILTYLPLVACATLIVFSAQMRQRISEPSMLFFIGTGVAINRMGSVWTRRIIHRVVSEPIDDISLLAENLVTSLRAGRSIIDSLVKWKGVTAIGTNVAVALEQGATLHVALRHLPDSTSSYRLAQAIESGFTDGLPLANTMHRIVDDTRNAMRHRSDMLIRQLPTRLSFPLVLCILPSFLFITVLPLMLNTLSRLGPVLSPSLTTIAS